MFFKPFFKRDHITCWKLRLLWLVFQLEILQSDLPAARVIFKVHTKKRGHEVVTVYFNRKAIWWHSELLALKLGKWQEGPHGPEGEEICVWHSKLFGTHMWL